MILTQQILNNLILEALNDMEAECLAQMAPIHSISKEFRGRDGIRRLASILKARADQSGKSWEDYLRDWKESVESQYGGTDLRSDALEDCLRKKKAKQSFGSCFIFPDSTSFFFAKSRTRQQTFPWSKL